MYLRSTWDAQLMCPFHYQEGDPKPKVVPGQASSASTSGSTGMGIGLYAIILLGGAAAFGAYKYLQSQDGKA